MGTDGRSRSARAGWWLTWVFGGAALGASACGGTTTAGTDAGAAEDAVVELDAALDDAFVEVDSGPELCAVGILFQQLPRVCLPRCTAQTERRYRNCFDHLFPPDGGAGNEETFLECEHRVLGNDETPETTLMVGESDRAIIDCQGCVDYQYQSCVATSCREEVTAYYSCVDDGGNTDQARATCSAGPTGRALNSCASARDNTINGCAIVRVDSCFPT